MKIFGKEIHVVYSLFLWAVIWEIVGHAGWFEIFPPLSEIFKAGWEMIPTDKFHNAIDITLRAYFSGMILAVVIGIPLGALMGASQVVDRLIGVWVNNFVSAPLTAAMPLPKARARSAPVSSATRASVATTVGLSQRA